MTKKRLSDMLKEEVQKEEGQKQEPEPKGPEPEAAKKEAKPDAPPEAAAKPAKTRTAPSRRTTGRRSAAAKPAAEKPAAEKPAAEKAEKPAAVEKPAVEKAAAPEAKPSSDSATPDLGVAAKVSELEQALQQAQAREATLQKQVNGLQEDLGKQQERLFELKDLLEKANAEAEAKTSQLTQVTAELETAKKDILKVTEAKSQPAQTPASTRRRVGADIVDRQIYGPRSQASRAKSLPEASFQPGPTTNSMLSNDEIGWVD
ncbi:hypothetical protein [Pseudanabaena sp. FACHB-2040]|uniref:hypothetical protein n=1 Tax=Pseudanabaena sp. FACHB-2040 TaxID=2692859 RepID=UPI00168659A0|nr:hypothetical protein [Pseudanabaena sp. FACHB-2040]MBD2256713.1 hypothetical protein [Pseudanabaena sp. FACHB-2040]